MPDKDQVDAAARAPGGRPAAAGRSAACSTYPKPGS